MPLSTDPQPWGIGTKWAIGSFYDLAHAATIERYFRGGLRFLYMGYEAAATYQEGKDAFECDPQLEVAQPLEVEP